MAKYFYLFHRYIKTNIQLNKKSYYCFGIQLNRWCELIFKSSLWGVIDFRDGVLLVCSFTRKLSNTLFPGWKLLLRLQHTIILSPALFTNSILMQKRNKIQIFINSYDSFKSKNTASDITHYLSWKKHTVLPKETLYGIAKQYRVTVKDLNKINPTLQKSGLKKGRQN
jgi:DNA-directed RNA polymerase subunit H (RpoH/RPB5)